MALLQHFFLNICAIFFCAIGAYRAQWGLTPHRRHGLSHVPRDRQWNNPVWRPATLKEEIIQLMSLTRRL